MIKFQKHYVTDGTTKVKVRYWINERSEKPSVEIYAKEYGYELDSLFGDLSFNNTDTMTDYFEKSHVKIHEGHPLYDQAKARAEQNAADWEARYQKRYAKI